MLPTALFCVGLLAPLVFLAGVTGAWVETNWAFLWLTLPWLVAMVGVRRLTPALGGLAALVAYAALTSLWSPAYAAVDGSYRLGVFVLAFVLAHEVSDLRPLLRGLALGLGVNGLVALAQVYFGLSTFYVVAPGAGLLVNPNALAEASALTLVALVTFGAWKWSALLIPGLVIPASRAPLLVLGTFALVTLWQRTKLGAIVVGLVVASLAVWWTESGAKLSSTAQRGLIWLDTLDGLTWFGHGLGSFGTMYPAYATRVNTALERPFHAHSDLLELTFELGFIGFALLAVLAVVVLVSSQREAIPSLAATFALCLVAFPLFVPLTSLLVGLLAGSASNDRAVDGTERNVRGLWRVPGVEGWQSWRYSAQRNVVAVCEGA